MSLLTEAEYAYKQQREAVMTARPRELRRALRQACKRAKSGSDLTLVRVKAIRDEYAARGAVPPRV